MSAVKKMLINGFSTQQVQFIPKCNRMFIFKNLENLLFTISTDR